VDSADGREQSRGKSGQVTRRKRSGFTLGSRRCWAAASPRPSDASPADAAAAAHSIPGDRPPAVPAVSRCRARQHHGQGRRYRAECAGSREGVTATGRYAAHCPGWPLQPQRCFASRWRGTRLRRAVDPGDLCQPSGPDGEGQAIGQALNARGELCGNMTALSGDEAEPRLIRPGAAISPSEG
jgi:hypothetical protein